MKTLLLPFCTVTITIHVSSVVHISTTLLLLAAIANTVTTSILTFTVLVVVLASALSLPTLFAWAPNLGFTFSEPSETVESSISWAEQSGAFSLHYEGPCAREPRTLGSTKVLQAPLSKRSKHNSSSARVRTITVAMPQQHDGHGMLLSTGAETFTKSLECPARRGIGLSRWPFSRSSFVLQEVSGSLCKRRQKAGSTAMLAATARLIASMLTRSSSVIWPLVRSEVLPRIHDACTHWTVARNRLLVLERPLVYDCITELRTLTDSICRTQIGRLLFLGFCLIMLPGGRSGITNCMPDDTNTETWYKA